MAVVALATAAISSMAQSDTPPLPAAASNPAGPVFIRYDEQVERDEAGPHEGGGHTTANRYFDEVPDPGLIFRRRALHDGAAIGVHALGHDEVYYVLSGRGELTVNELKAEVMPGAAIYLRLGAQVGLRQLGEDDLVIIIAYPPINDAGPTPAH